MPWTDPKARKIRNRTLKAVDSAFLRGNVASWVKAKKARADDLPELRAYAVAMGWTGADALDRARAARERQRAALA